jgi:hypothetical protein
MDYYLHLVQSYPFLLFHLFLFLFLELFGKLSYIFPIY